MDTKTKDFYLELRTEYENSNETFKSYYNDISNRKREDFENRTNYSVGYLSGLKMILTRMSEIFPELKIL